MRLFTAIELPDPVRDHLQRVIARGAPAAPAVRWTRRENLHLTLKFIGEVSDPDLPALIEALGSAAPAEAMELHCARLVCFPPRRPVRIVAAEVGGDTQPLEGLFERIETALAGICRREHRRYTPHITLGRAKSGLPAPQRAQLASAAEPGFPGPAFSAHGMTLFSSELMAEGPVYRVAARF